MEYCRKNAIQVEAYCPLVRGTLMKNPTILGIAARHSTATPSQILIRWCLQHGFIPLPKSDNPQRIRENAGAYSFELDASDMKLLDSMDLGVDGALVPQNTDCP